MSKGSFVERAAQTIVTAPGTQAARDALFDLLVTGAWCAPAEPEESQAGVGRELSLGRASVRHAVAERRLGQTVRTLRALSPIAQAGVAGKILAAEAVRLASEAWGWQRLADGLKLLTRRGDALGRGARPDLETGVCGRHGAEPRSIRMLHLLGLDYVSVPAAQVANARVAAAQAALLEA